MSFFMEVGVYSLSDIIAADNPKAFADETWSFIKAGSDDTTKIIDFSGTAFSKSKTRGSNKKHNDLP